MTGSERSSDGPPVVVRTRAEVRAAVHAARCGGATVGFVPTMGALHAGHLSLVTEARERTDHVVVSIFVNPTQFAPGEDLDAYPRDLDGDLAMLASDAVHRPDLVFAPSVTEMYRRPAMTEVRVPPLADTMDGERRPGHFDGVGLVVTKLLSIVRPDVAVFGRKDVQQLQIVRRLVDDLDLGVQIVGAPIVREPDGLAMSSRNRYLDGEDRVAARVLSRSLRAAVEHARAARDAGHAPSPGRLEEVVRVTLGAEPRARVDDVAVRDPDTLAPPDIRGEAASPAHATTHDDDTEHVSAPQSHAGTRLLVAIAAVVGSDPARTARLIDNVVVGDTDDEDRLLAATA